MKYNISMDENKFIDYVVVYIKSGHGGKGAVSFYSNKQGPCGGKGGKGGDVIIKGDSSVNNLDYFKHNVHLFAQDGNTGGSNNITGKNGSDIIIRVPYGTEISFTKDSEPTSLYIIDNQSHVLLKGGRGGLGNGSFKSSCNQIPRYSQPGEPSISSKMTIELKSLGDFGLIGAPNAGKSTLIRSMTNSPSAIGDYAFTTVRPYQGMCGKVCIVDLPGIVPDAHLGKGLGFRFLKHAENCQNLLMVIDVSDQPIHQIEFLLKEINIYGLKPPEYLILNKVDKVKNKHIDEIANIFKHQFKKIFYISAALDNGIKALSDYLQKLKTSNDNRILKESMENMEMLDEDDNESPNMLEEV